ncbi:calcium-binding protein [uncultured Thiocystis sp.]|jgi:Ca2+-binding RTX toxin-like protein|uniref:calcium-binding protein n=1 Tax=uncultured Thiocystis sp. TaxID=1202134 RepID=UPI0025FBE772|nr:calcium-binding protein [uncultured Thiocystis sp.]
MAIFPGTPNPDTYDGTASADAILGKEANDILNGLGGDDTIYGGAGNDTLTGGEGNDTIYDDDNNPFNDPQSDNDSIRGGAGNDSIISSQGNHFQDIDFLYGDDGDDIVYLSGTQTGDTADGGIGTDTLGLFLTRATQSIFAAFNTAGFQVQLGGVNVVFASAFERVTIRGGWAADNLTGSNLNDTLGSNGVEAGTEVIRGLGGNDFIEILMVDYRGFGGTYDIDGGTGTDTFYFNPQRGTSQSIAFTLGSTYTIGGTSIGTIAGVEIANFSGGTGNDTLIGGARADQLFGDNGDDTLRGLGGNDSMIGGSGADTLYGGDGNDRLTENIGNGSEADQLFGEAGNDFLSGGVGNDILDGGIGNDTYDYQSGDAIIDASGIDSIQTRDSTLDLRQFAMIENVLALSGSTSTVTGNALANRIEVLGTSFGSLSSDTGAGDDIAFGGYKGSDMISGNDGRDRLAGRGGSDTLNGGNDNDVLRGGDGNDALNGDAGSDTIYGGDQNDRISGGAGDDILYGDSIDPTAVVGLGTGHLTKSAAPDNSPAPVLTDISSLFKVAADPNVIASDVLPHLTVDSTMTRTGTFGDGLDQFIINVLKPGAKLIVDVDRAHLPGTLFSDINITGPNSFDTGRSFNFAPKTAGAGGSNTTNDAYVEFELPVAGRYIISISDDSFGQSTDLRYRVQFSIGTPGGDDILDGGAGNDRLNGQRGNDQASYASATAAVTASLLVTTPQDTRGGGTDTFVSIEGLIGSRFGDTLTGDAKANVIEGGDGNDTLIGGLGTDTLSYASATADVNVNLALTAIQNTAGAGRDLVTGFESLTGSGFNDSLRGTAAANVINGLAGDDTIFGLGGNDTITGGQGVDVLSGGLGRDVFVYDERTPFGSPVAQDEITDFKSGEDKIDLKLLSFASFAYAGTGPFTSGTQLEVRHVKTGANTTVEFDWTGDDVADMSILLLGVATLTPNDFIL